MLKSILGKTFQYGKDSCWWLERKRGRLFFVAAQALDQEAEVKFSFWLDDEEEMWSESHYSKSSSDDWEKITNHIKPETHAELLDKFRDVADKVLRKLGGYAGG